MSDWDFLLVPYGGQSQIPDLQIRLKLSLLEGKLHFLFLFEAPPLQIKSLRWPQAARPERRNELWQTTCCELFFGPAGERSYFELNLSPSGDWNVYQFDDYRTGHREAKIESSPFKMSETTPVYRVEGQVDLNSLGLRLEKSGDVVLGATAVVEYQDGNKEYWALAHKGDKPDFHIRESFTAYL